MGEIPVQITKKMHLIFNLCSVPSTSYITNSQLIQLMFQFKLISFTCSSFKVKHISLFQRFEFYFKFETLLNINANGFFVYSMINGFKWDNTCTDYHLTYIQFMHLISNPISVQCHQLPSLQILNLFKSCSSLN